MMGIHTVAVPDLAVENIALLAENGEGESRAEGGASSSSSSRVLRWWWEESRSMEILVSSFRTLSDGSWMVTLTLRGGGVTHTYTYMHTHTHTHSPCSRHITPKPQLCVLL